MNRIGLIDVDSHNYPNLCLMKISAYHKNRGDSVEWWNGLMHYDRVYMSKVFDETYSQDMEFCINADEVIRGGTGYGLENKLPDEIEHIMPDYSLYGITDTAYGFLTRGCPRSCPFCIVSEKEGRKSVKVADLSEFWGGQKYIELLDPNLLACRDAESLLLQLAESKAIVNFSQGLDCRLLDRERIEHINRVNYKLIHFAWDNMKDEKAVLTGLELFTRHATRKPHGSFATVYVLTNYGTTVEEDLHRIHTVAQMGLDPYVMVFDKPNAPQIVTDMQRWCNNKVIFKTVKDFKDYIPTRQMKGARGYATILPILQQSNLR